MKRMLVLVLAIVMVMSMAVPAAAAVNSPAAQKADLKPILTEESELIVELHTTEDVKELDEKIQDLMAEAKESLKDACPKGFAVKYFFYVEIIGGEGPIAVDFEPIAHKEIVLKQYVDGKWAELKFTVNEDSTITVSGVVKAPLAVFVK